MGNSHTHGLGWLIPDVQPLMRAEFFMSSKSCGRNSRCPTHACRIQDVRPLMRADFKIPSTYAGRIQDVRPLMRVELRCPTTHAGGIKDV